MCLTRLLWDALLDKLSRSISFSCWLAWCAFGGFGLESDSWVLEFEIPCCECECEKEVANQKTGNTTREIVISSCCAALRHFASLCDRCGCYCTVNFTGEAIQKSTWSCGSGSNRWGIYNPVLSGLTGDLFQSQQINDGSSNLLSSIAFVTYPYPHVNHVSTQHK